MKIRKCPHCAQHNHFHNEPCWARCWNCRLWTDFAALKNFDERCALYLDRLISRAISSVASPRLIRHGRVALMAALPLVVVMLLICNTLNIHIVHDVSTSFDIP